MLVFELDVMLAECLHHLVMTSTSNSGGDPSSTKEEKEEEEVAVLLSRAKPLALLHHLSWYTYRSADTTDWTAVLVLLLQLIIRTCLNL
jgi:hypothetical protein